MVAVVVAAPVALRVAPLKLLICTRSPPGTQCPDLLLEDIASVFVRDRVRSFEVGVLGRRLAERIATDLGASSRGDLADRITKLADCGVASWIRSYLHVLRIFGNESVHEQGGRERTPTHVEAGDVAIGLFCLQRPLEFWAERRHATEAASA